MDRKARAYLKKAVAVVEKAKEQLTESVMQAMADVGTREGLSKIVIHVYGRAIYRRGKEIYDERILEELREIEDFELEHGNRNGFQGVWTPRKGWH
jgi:hypothetical protein